MKYINWNMKYSKKYKKNNKWICNLICLIKKAKSSKIIYQIIKIKIKINMIF